METNNLIHSLCSSPDTNQEKMRALCGKVFLSSSHGCPASLFPSSLGTRFKSPEDAEKALHICQLLHHGRSTRLRTEPFHLRVEQKPDLCARHPQLFSTNTKSPASPTGSLKVRHAFPVAYLSCRLKRAKKAKKKKKKKWIRFSQELPGKMRLVFFQYQVLEGLFAGFPFFFIC